MVKQMNHDREVVAIVNKLKESAQAFPWVPLGVPPRQHYHRFPNGLTVCLTLDVVPGFRNWHLSIARVPGGPTPEEIEFWRHAFFDEKPTIELPSQILGLLARHFHWRCSDAAS